MLVLKFGFWTSEMAAMVSVISETSSCYSTGPRPHTLSCIIDGNVSLGGLGAGRIAYWLEGC